MFDCPLCIIPVGITDQNGCEDGLAYEGSKATPLIFISIIFRKNKFMAEVIAMPSP
jgi:hypothetical protein